jgi:hypothetical protein
VCLGYRGDRGLLQNVCVWETLGIVEVISNFECFSGYSVYCERYYRLCVWVMLYLSFSVSVFWGTGGTERVITECVCVCGTRLIVRFITECECLLVQGD